MKYTIKSVTPTGKADQGYGTPYYIEFNEDDRKVYAQKKSVPQIGDEWSGEIVADKYGFKFKKDAFVPNAQAPAQAPASAPRAFKDNSDGMRQGMCFNNAANYVNSINFTDKEGKPRALTDVEWADLVWNYAQALYLLGDLNKEKEANQETNSVADVFGGN